MQLPLSLRDPLYRLYNGVNRLAARPEILLWPPLSDQEKLDDLLARLRFHFPEGHELIVPVTTSRLTPSGRVPWHMHDYTERCRSAFRIMKARPGNRNAIALALRYRGLLLTDHADRVPGGRVARYLPNAAPIDPNDVEMETFWIAKLHLGDRQAEIAPSRARFEAYRRALPKRRKAYLLCTGPSLSRFAEFDFSDGYVIACNSVVSNDRLMDHAKPDFIVASDPIFHFGPSIYAEKFRQDLAAAATRFPFLFLTLNSYHHILRHHLAMDRERVCEVPLRLDTEARALHTDWSVPQTANIMTMFMLPLARALADEIHIIGADGREPGETYFWKHDPASQLTDKMQAIKACHPAFFAKRDYVDYYDRHCAIVKDQVASIESAGGRVYTLTPSHIPALRDRPSPAFRP
jgi:hypothetical protein